ncbi:MAG: hypothetical protein JXR25_13580 [Pontiellaceae bacterium]|nr:hypothetical protein [Pontiellaceae bacterium]MBN2785847.1 hypothetical protein [Pontiellaceae bacterium]
MKKMVLRLVALMALSAGISNAELRVLIDFGPSNDDDGRATASPDTSGNYWNSWRPYPGDTGMPAGTSYIGSIVDTANNVSGIGLVMIDSFNCNGIKNGGLLAPNAGLLGDLAIDTATEDYWFETAGGSVIKINGLDPTQTYHLRMFGTRETDSSRITRYTVTDASGDHATDLQTSGAGIGTGGYNGNNDTIAAISNLIPNASGELLLDVSVVEGGYAYLGILEITSDADPVVTTVPAEVVVVGSSVASGSGANPQSDGWAYRLKSLLEGEPVVTDSVIDWSVYNASIGGDTTTKVLARFDSDVSGPYAGAEVVMIGLSLANEGLIGSASPQSVFDSFKNGLTTIVNRCREEGFYPVITLCYPQNLYSADEYAWVRRMNLLLNTWDVPCVNFLGAIDDGNGHWVAGYYADDGHPNSLGHLEMYSAIVPTFFDAVLAGKTNTADWAGTRGYLRLQQGASSTSPLAYAPAHEYRSLTLSFRLRTTDTGTVAAIESAGTSAALEIREGELVYIAPTGAETSIAVSLNDGSWHDLALSHRKPTAETLLFVDGRLMATVSGSLGAESFVVGGPGSVVGRAAAPLQADYQDVAIYRAAWTEDEALAQSSGALQQASLDVLATLNDGAGITNTAQSVAVMSLDTASYSAGAFVAGPDGLTAHSCTDGTASLSWTDHADGSASFTVERRRTGVAEAWNVVATVESPFYDDTGLESGTSYDYRVSIAEGELQGDYSNVASVAPAGQDTVSYSDWIESFYPRTDGNAVYLIDFNAGSADYGAVNWNTVASSGVAAPLSISDTIGRSSDITVAVSDSFDQTRTDAGSVSSVYASGAQSSLFALRDDSPLIGAITFAGLDPAASYDFSFFARRGALVGGFDYSGTYTFAGAGDPVVLVVDAAVNNALAHAPSVTPDASGVVTLTITAGPGEGTDFPVINFIRLEKSVPGVHLIDFNTNADPDYGLVNWNTVSSLSSSGAYALSDQYGSSAGFSLTMSDGFDQFRNDTITDVPDFSGAAQNSQFALRDDNPLTAAMTFSGLDPSALYEFSFFSKRGSLVGGFDYSGTFTFSGSGDPVVVISDAAVNTDLTEVPALKPDASGNITLGLAAGPGSGTDFPVLNLIRFAEAVLSPEYLALIDPEADPDGDGLSNFEEYARNLDPTTADGSPFLIHSFEQDTTRCTLEIEHDLYAVDAGLILESSENLQIWTPDETVVPMLLNRIGTKEYLRYEVPVSGDKRFFRFAVTGP